MSLRHKSRPSFFVLEAAHQGLRYDRKAGYVAVSMQGATSAPYQTAAPWKAAAARNAYYRESTADDDLGPPGAAS